MDNLGKIDAAAGKLHDEDAVVDTNAPPMPQVEAVPVSAPTPTPTPTPAPPRFMGFNLSTGPRSAAFSIESGSH